MLTYLRKNMKTIMVVVAVLFAASMFYGLGMRGFKQVKGEGVTGLATIDGREIDKMRFNQNLQRLAAGIKTRLTVQETAYLQMLALSQIVDYTLMLSEAKKNVRVGGDEVGGALSQIMQANKIPTKSDFENAIKKNGFTMDGFKQMVKEDILIQKMISKVRGAVNITPDDLREVRASHILIVPKIAVSSKETDAKRLAQLADVKAKSLAEELLARIKKGESFGKLAAEYSDDAGSKVKGGDLGYFTTGAMVPEFEKAVFALKPGEVSGLIKSPFGYHIAKLTDTRLRTISEKGKDIKEVILAQKQDNAFRQWMSTLKQKAKIVITNPFLRAYDLRLRGQVEGAISEYNVAVSEKPNDPYLHVLLGDTYEQKGDLELAIAEYVKAQSLNSSDPDIAITLGNAYEKVKKLVNDKTGKYRKLSLEQYDKASLLAGENKDLHKQLADTYKTMGEYKLERAELSRIAQIEAREKFEEEIRKKTEGSIEAR